MKNYWLQTKDTSSAINLKIFGLLSSISFQYAKYLAEMLYSHQKFKYNKPQYRSLLEFDWIEYRYKLNKNIGGQAWALIRDVAVFWNDELLGNENDLFNVLLESNLFLKNVPDRSELVAAAKKAKTDYFNKDPDKAFVFFEISENEAVIGTFVFELYSDLLPETCDTFMHLCINHPLKPASQTYAGSKLHRIAKSGWVQGGDIGWKDANYYPDECYAVDHDRRGILSLANCGRDRNGSQFFINFNPAPWMDTYYVAIGRIIEGHSLLQRLENAKTYYESPCSSFVITNSGVLPYGRGRNVREAFITETIDKIHNRFKFMMRQQNLNLIQSKLTTVSKIDALGERIKRTKDLEVGSGEKVCLNILEKNVLEQKIVETILEKILNNTFLSAATHEVHPDTEYSNQVSSAVMTKDRFDLGFYSEPLLRASLLQEFLELCYDRGFLERPPADDASETEIKSWDLSEPSDTTINYILRAVMNAVGTQCYLAEDRIDVISIIDRLINEVTDVSDLSQYEAAVRDQAKLFLSELFKEALDRLMPESSLSLELFRYTV
ncbi:hypothetical protein LSTR_LSTR001271 [Laodelphax striatellus]|uniref:PPIase cyclophilin-type domain-containing protein n=1 Tax=Laodelphax striatellus TaxID=195883 RepID=A0A482XBN8_LAOST|nr:hypothetical protein LSTR_LSTR001271 [Laodelphax striatellus]